jgi:hypothetical protein
MVVGIIKNVCSISFENSSQLEWLLKSIITKDNIEVCSIFKKSKAKEGYLNIFKGLRWVSKTESGVGTRYSVKDLKQNFKTKIFIIEK